MRPETESWNGYVEDTIVIDWQTPAVRETARRLAGAEAGDEAKARACYAFVRDEIAHSADAGHDALPCRASEVLAARTGIGFAKSHLLAALLRASGVPAGFCYQVVRRGEDEAGTVLYGFNGVYLASLGRWIGLDARGNRAGLDAQFSTDEPSLAVRGEWVYPKVYTRPAQVVVDLLSRNSSLAKIADHIPEELPGVKRE
ncbi:MAG TPA: transglutaminase-like domain-containing protein [Burkholderiales bacterium]|nr:transglutaminase-like domain-containing protein [Burkholderiales bacterium]